MKGDLIKMILASGLLGIVAVGREPFLTQKVFLGQFPGDVYRGKFRVSQGNSIDVLAFELVLNLSYPLINV